jgi:DNA-binding MarR family transcriptional regulator
MQQSETVEDQLGRVAELFTRWIRRVPTEADLSFPAAATLVRLTLDGPHRLTDLAAVERTSQPGMTQLVTRLEADGLVRRSPAPGDRRVVLVEVTPSGAALVERRRRQRAAQLRGLLEGLAPPDRDTVEAALPALLRLAETAVSALPASTPTATSVTTSRSSS